MLAQEQRSAPGGEPPNSGARNRSELGAWAAAENRSRQRRGPASGSKEKLPPRTPRRIQWEGLRWLWNNSLHPSQASCRRWLAYGERSVGVHITPGTGDASFTGLGTCGSCHSCPVCADGIWRERAANLHHLLRMAVDSQLHVAMLTLTLRHKQADDLATLLGGCAQGWNAVTKSRAWKHLQKEFGIVGVVRRLEVTVGANGWHPHLHILVFTELDPGELGWLNVRSAAYSAWRAKLSSLGLRTPSQDRGVHVKPFDLWRGPEALERAVSSYMTAAGTVGSHQAERAEQMTVGRAAGELASAGTKQAKGQNLTVWGLLDAAMSGDAQAIARWHEYEQAIKGRQAWAVSSSLQRLAAEFVEKVPEEPKRSCIGQITAKEWKLLCQATDGPGVLLDEVAASYRDELRRSGDHEAALCAAALALDFLLTEWLPDS